MTLKKYIADSLGTANGYAYPSMSDDLLDIKIDYSKEFLSVVSLIDPGVTKVKNQVGNKHLQQKSIFILII